LENGGAMTRTNEECVRGSSIIYTPKNSGPMTIVNEKCVKVEPPITNGISYWRYDLKYNEVKEKYAKVQLKKLEVEKIW